MKKITPVILSGGTGSRLWPLSRSDYPKQFLPIVGDKSLFVQTAERVQESYGFSKPVVIANDAHRFIVNQQMDEAGLAIGDFFLEPVGRNTAPAILIAALHAEKVAPKSLLLFLPSDHVVLDVPGFHKAVSTAAAAADAGRLVCFGIKPLRPETGYGYIQAGAGVGGMDGAFKVRAFYEKPDQETADTYLASGNYSWNSGIFLFRSDVVIAELTRFAPAMVEACRAALGAVKADLNFHRLDTDLFGAVPSDSVDYALLEKTDKAVVVPAEMGWSDLGSFSALWNVGTQDTEGNVALGDTVSIDTRNSFIQAGDKLVTTVGVDNLIIVSTDDAVLVADKNADQNVKQVVDSLKASNRSEAHQHSTIYRPWGSYRSIAIGERFQVKEIMVYPGKRLSLQLHHHRSEHWVIVEGEAIVTRGEEAFPLKVDESVYLPVETKHRLENPGTVPLRLVEVQTGPYLGEDDIFRFEDDFNRSSDD